MSKMSAEQRELLTYIDRQMGYHHESQIPGMNPDWRLPYASDTEIVLMCDMCGEYVRAVSAIALMGIRCVSCESLMVIRRDRNAQRVRLTPYTIARDGYATMPRESLMG